MKILTPGYSSVFYYSCTLAVPALAYLYEPALENAQRIGIGHFLVRGLSPHKAFCQGVYW